MANYVGNSGVNTYTGTEGDDVIDGRGGRDVLKGAGGADRFLHRAGTQVDGPSVAPYYGATLDGGDGIDSFEVIGGYLETFTYDNTIPSQFYSVRPLPYTLTLGAGGDVIWAQNQRYMNAGGTINDTAYATTLRNIETASLVFTSNPVAPQDYYVLSGNGHTTFDPYDTVVIGNLTGSALTGAISFDGGIGDDVLDARSAVNVILAQGGVQSDHLMGGSANDVLSGGDGDDILAGGGGANVLDGGAGLDDRADYSEAVQGVRVDLNDGTVANNGYGLSDTLIGIEHLTGSDLDDILVGNAAANHLIGGLGADYLAGLDGADVLDGGEGAANTLQGGAGDDIYYVRAVGDSVVEFAGQGYDEVRTTRSSYQLSANVEALTYIGGASLTGVGNGLDNRITGGLGGDYLIGQAGNDILIGGAGAANTLQGGVGDDAYFADAVGDSIVEFAGEGNDTVYTRLLSFTLGANVEDLIFSGTVAGATGVGNGLANLIRGDTRADSLSGLAGNDQLQGMGGDDILRGGLGADILDGGTGIDTADYSQAAAGVFVNLTSQSASNDGDGGADSLISIENATGSAFNDVLAGSAVDNVLIGGAGADVLAGYAGNDILVGGGGAANQMIGGLGDDRYVVSAVGDSLIEYAGEGTDTVETVLAAYTLRDHIENLIYTGAGAFIGTGNSAANAVTGGAGNDRLSGLAGDDQLTGGAGDDVINGGAGSDIMSGGDGVDTVDYTGASGGVTIRLHTNNAIDGAWADTLSGFENAIGSAFDDTIFGTAGDNVLTGGAGADVLLGLAGNDVLIGGGGAANQMQGGLGDDRYIVSVAGDTLTEFSGEGTDTVETTLSAYVLRDHFENLTYTGAGAFTGTGNTAANVLTGAGGADTFTGGLGDDAVHGGGGIDTVVMSGVRADYTVGSTDGHFYIQDNVAGRDGLDTLYDVERIRFSDGSVLDLTAPLAGPALAEAALARIAPDFDVPSGETAGFTPEISNSWDTL